MTDLPLNSPGVRVSAWRWAWIQTRRDLRAPSMRFLVLAVVLAVAALTAVAFFADRIERGLTRDAAQLLGADAVVVADRPVPADLHQEAQRLGLRLATTAVLSSMARTPDERGGDTRLITLKAVSEHYPLRGRLMLAAGAAMQPGAQPSEAAAQSAAQVPAPAGGPPPGEAWVDPALLLALDLHVGDEIWLGEAAFRIAAVVASEPDRGASFASFAPRVLIRQSDLVRTELVQPASRVTYRLLVAGPARPGDAEPAPDARADNGADNGADTGAGSEQNQLAQRAGPEAVQAFAAAARKEGARTRGLQVDTLDQGRPEMRMTLDRAGLFLRLVALLAALLAAVAVALVSRDFAQRRLDDCALLRVLGVPQRVMAWSYGLQFAWVGLLASALGLLAGWCLHLVFVHLLASLVGVALPAAGWLPWVIGVGVGVLLTLGFGLPPVLQLARVPPLRVLRRDLGTLKPLSTAVWLLGGAALVILLLAVARDLRMGAIALGGFAVAVLVFSLLGGVAVWVLRSLADRLAGRAPNWWTLGTRQLTSQPVHTVVQVCALSIGLLALMLLVLIRTDLIDSWRAATPADAPDRFVINILPEQVADFQRSLHDAGIARFDWYPMTRARLVAINERPVSAADYASDERAQRLVEREFNLSHAAQLPDENPVVAGRFVSEEADAISVEEGIAKRLGMRLGDRLRFDVAGTPFTARITSLRKVDWSSMRVNFFVLAPHAEMPQWPETYITAFKTVPRSTLDRTLVQRFPNITVVDVSATLQQIQGVLGQVITAVEFLFLFALATGVVVLMAGLMTSRERRAQEWAVLRAMGATQGLLSRVQSVELLGLGALAGAMSACAALAIGWGLATWVFEFAWQAPWWWVLPGALVGAALAWLAGWWSLRGVLQRPVALTLRQAD